MPYKDPEDRKAWRRRNRSKEAAWTADWNRRRREAGIPWRVRVTRAAADRQLFKNIERLAQPNSRLARCRMVVAMMFAHLPRNEVRKPVAPAKHKAYRDRLRAEAVAALGGCCTACGFSDIRALDIARVPALERGANGLRKNNGLGPKAHRRILNGDTEGVQLLCANCRCIRIRSDATIHSNLTFRTPPDRPPPPAPGLLGTGAAGPRSGSGAL